MRKELFLLFGIMAFLFVTGSAMAYTQDLYYYKSSSSGNFNLTAESNFTLNGTCSNDVRIYADINATGSYNYNFYLYENNSILFTNPQSGSGQQSCLFLGNLAINKEKINLTGQVVSIGSPVPVNLFLEIHSNCAVNNSNPLVVINHPIGSPYQQFTSQTAPYITTPPNTTYLNMTPDRCVISNKFPPVSVTGFSYPQASQYFVPFNSKLGDVVLTYFFATNAYSNEKGGYIDLDTNQSTELFIYGGTNPSNGTQAYLFNLTLDQNHNYVEYFIVTVSGSTITYNPPVLTPNINDYQPNYVCGNYSLCDNVTHTQSALCNDTGNIAPPIFRTRSCLRTNETAILGFENYYTPANRYICQPVLYPLCGLHGYEGLGALQNVTVLYPNNPRWDIFPDNPVFYTTTITNEEATQGSRSLKMWFVPQSPYNDQPTPYVAGNTSGIYCLNSSTGMFPTTSFGGVNSTFLASLNFTFPSDTMRLSFDVKKCTQNVVQYNNWCGKRCYSQNCTTPPTGWYEVRLFDQTTFSEVFDYTSEANDNWTTISIDIGSNILIDQNYTMAFDVLPLPFNPTSADGNCVYFDNIRLVNQQVSIYDLWANDVYGTIWSGLSDEQKLNVLTQKCVSQCIGNNYYTRTVQNLVCLETITLNDSTCVSTNPVNIISGNQSLFQPIQSICNQIVNTTTNQTYCDATKTSGFGFSLLFLTPIFWLMALIIAVMTGVSWLTSHMEVGLGSGILLLVGFTLVFPELLFITIAIVVIVGFIVGRTAVKAVVGGG
jgi:hypothetical protein